MNCTNGETVGKNVSAEYTAWLGMKSRCTNKNATFYSHYGGRGITVCDRWLYSFVNFLEDMGRKPTPLHSLDRHPDVNGEYGPSNCRWATRFEQQRNVRSNIWLEYNGIKKLQVDWAKIFGVHSASITVKRMRGQSDTKIVEYYLHKRGISIDEIAKIS